MNYNENYVNDFHNTIEDRKLGRDLIKEMITLVHKRKPLWERDYHDRDTKMQLWQETANLLGMSVDVCQQRWKGLREKYIRQKRKYLDGGDKWEYLDDLSFLDNAISYRKRYLQQSDISNDSQFDQFSSSDCEFVTQHRVEYETIKTEEQSVSGMSGTESIHAVDSSTINHRQMDSSNTKKRDVSCDSEEFLSKRSKYEKCNHRVRTPEEIFGEFVSACLASKAETERSMLMVEIMQVLTKTN